MNDVIKNVQEELVEVNLIEGGEERVVKIRKRFTGRRKKKVGIFVKGIQRCFRLKI